jgi:Secretion system C-terminal sorting domain/Copper binding proteins, plastocyanin/azurin family
MKKITLLVALLVASITQAQTTFPLDWELGATGLDLTIQQGDTVEWTWRDGLTHTVTNITGSQEDFDSGTITGEGMTFSFTFAEIGTNPYECQIHPGSMNGTITVEESLGVDEVFLKNLQLFPNPVDTELTLFSIFKLESYIIYDFAGRKVISGRGEGNFTSINMNAFQAGVYFVAVTSEDGLQATKKIVKK